MILNPCAYPVYPPDVISQIQVIVLGMFYFLSLVLTLFIRITIPGLLVYVSKGAIFYL